VVVQILLFASYREVIGEKEVTLTCPERVTVRQCAKQLEQTYGLFLEGALCAINEHYATPDSVIQEGDRVAFFPPVSGGQSNDTDDTDDVFVVTEKDLVLEHYHKLATANAWGAQASFVGTVRSPNAGHIIKHIDYQGYDAMIITQMRTIAQELRGQFDLGKIVIVHRLGRLFPGDASIVIVVASAHRREALAACSACIDLCKVRLPVWKYEVTADEAHWVAGSSDAAPTL
jgi:molybdopterin synthase catalytic subunit